MFGDIVSMLERKGALENAIVVVLSDHGEALELPRGHDDRRGDAGSRAARPSWRRGFRSRPERVVARAVSGAARISELRFWRGFRGRRARPGRRGDGGGHSSDAAGLARVHGDPLSATGQSFAALLRGERGAGRVGAADRVRFTETDLRVLPRTDGGVDEAATAEHNARFFVVDPQSGRMHVRADFVPLVLAFKERAAFTDRSSPCGVAGRSRRTSVRAGGQGHTARRACCWIARDQTRRRRSICGTRCGDTTPASCDRR